MIKLSGISKSFGEQTLFEDLTFNVNRRERVGLVGRNGHGKTTLFRIILGEVQAEGGEVMVPKRYRIGHLDQHLHFVRGTVREEASLGLRDGHRDQTWKAERILSGLGFSERDMSLPPEQFSGGYQVRLNLAKLLVSEPDMLLLDEPTNYLDVVSIRWLARFLRAWPTELMLITHDRSFMDSVITHTVGIHRRRAKKIEGGTGKLYAQILQEEEIYEKTRINDDKKRKEVERFIERFRAKNSLATRVQSRIKHLAKHKRLDKLDRIQILEFSFHSAPFPAKSMMKIEDLSFGYDDARDLFSALSFEIRSSDRVCVIGQNGKGKTTLLRLLAGELPPRRGRITSHPRLSLGHFVQTNVKTLNPHNNVVEEILSADLDCLPQTARNIAGAMMFERDDALKRVSVLSGGEKSRVMLGKLIVSPTNLLLLDEPTNHLDMDSCDSLLAAVDAFEGAVVMVTHNEMFLHTLATRFIVFDRGRVFLYDHSYQDFLDRVGWEMDDSLAPKKSVDTTTSAPAMDKKALRKARAKIQQQRSKAVAPLKNRVNDLEARIGKLEPEAESALRALHEAAAEGDASAIAGLSKTSDPLNLKSRRRNSIAAGRRSPGSSKSYLDRGRRPMIEV
jgi:ATP-binding cassette subfamily F protein 3